jgi:hypothetical protein
VPSLHWHSGHHGLEGVQSRVLSGYGLAPPISDKPLIGTVNDTSDLGCCRSWPCSELDLRLVSMMVSMKTSST